jgi:hypothetical protein
VLLVGDRQARTAQPISNLTQLDICRAALGSHDRQWATAGATVGAAPGGVTSVSAGVVARSSNTAFLMEYPVPVPSYYRPLRRRALHRSSVGTAATGTQGSMVILPQELCHANALATSDSPADGGRPRKRAASVVPRPQSGVRARASSRSPCRPLPACGAGHPPARSVDSRPCAHAR